MPRLYCPTPLCCDALLDLPPSAARHVQVLRLQPGDAITLFDGSGGQYDAQVLEMGRSRVQVRVGAHAAQECEAQRPIHLLAAITAGDRMDWLVEKATELGAASLTPIAAERSALKPRGEHAQKKQAHWQAVAAAACEQCGRNRIPHIAPIQTLAQALQALPPAPHEGARRVLSLQPHSRNLRDGARADGPLWLASGPEGGWSAPEEALMQAQGFVPVTLGPRVMRAETAPLAALAVFLL